MRTLFIVIIISSLIGSVVFGAEPPTNTSVLKETALKQTPPVPNLVIENKTENMDRGYVELLEKINQQLSLRWYPYQASMGILSIAIGALSVLVTIGAIISGIVIYRQGAEYKKAREAEFRIFLDAQGQRAEKMRMDLETKARELDNQIKKVEEEAREKIKTMETASQEVKKAEYEKLKDELIKLVAKRNAIQSEVSNLSNVVPIEYDDYLNVNTSVGVSSIGSPSSAHRCSQCKFGFRLADTGLPSTVFGTRSGKVQCPKCGNIDRI